MEIYITRNGERYGPYTLAEVQTDIDAGNILPTDLAWHNGATDWHEVWQLEGVNVPKRRVPPPPPPRTAYYPNMPPKPPSVGGGEMVIFILLSVLLPIAGLIIGIVWMSKPEKRSEGGILLLVALVLMIIYAIIFSQM